MDGIYAQNGGTTSHWRTIFKLALFILGRKENFWTAAVFDFRPVSDVIQDGGQWPYWKLTLAISREVNVVNACVISIN